MIDQLAQFSGIRAAETFLFFQPLQPHLEPADPPEQLGLLGLSPVLVLVCLPPRTSLLAPSSSCSFHLLTRIGSHRRVRCIAQPHGLVGGDLLDRHAAADRLHGDPGPQLGTWGAALAQLLRRRLHRRWEPPFRAGAPPQRLTIGGLSRKARPPQFLRFVRLWHLHATTFAASSQMKNHYLPQAFHPVRQRKKRVRYFLLRWQGAFEPRGFTGYRGRRGSQSYSITGRCQSTQFS